MVVFCCDQVLLFAGGRVARRGGAVEAVAVKERAGAASRALRIVVFGCSSCRAMPSRSALARSALALAPRLLALRSLARSPTRSALARSSLGAHTLARSSARSLRARRRARGAPQVLTLKLPFEAQHMPGLMRKVTVAVDDVSRKERCI